MNCNQLDILSTQVDATILTDMKNKSVLEYFSTENIDESEKDRVVKLLINAILNLKLKKHMRIK